MKPAASLSLDLDNQWSYMKTRGLPEWQSLPTYLDRVVPRFLALLEEKRLSLTVFVVGQDAARAENHAALQAIAAAGHEIGNHSFHHEPWLHRYSDAEIEAEIARTEEAIHEATGRRTTGFRGPGYSLSPAVLSVLARRGYRYDCSTLPTFLGPLARAYYFFRSPLRREDREQRQALFGTVRDGLRPISPYRWDNGLVEIPVTTMPFLRLPFHFSYVLYLSGFSPLLGRAYFWLAIQLCRAVGLGPSLLLHPLDFLDARDVPELAFFPAMDVAWEKKRDLVGRLLDALRGTFDVGGMSQHVDRLEAQPLRVLSAAEARLQ
jgi:hypothetical protein